MEAVRKVLQTTLEKAIEDQERYANEHRAEVPPIQVGDFFTGGIVGELSCLFIY